MSEAVKLKPARLGGIELLRIISMVMIVVFHFFYHTDWVFGETVTFNEYLVNFMMSFGKVGVAIFFMITGYFLYIQKDFSHKKIRGQVFKILRPMWFYSFASLAFGYFAGMKEAELSFPANAWVVRSVFPILSTAYWFVSAYVVITLMSPILRKWFDAMTMRDILGLLALLMLATWGTRFSGFIVGQRWEAALNLGGAGFYYVLVGYFVNRFGDRLRKSWSWAMIVASLVMFALGPILKFGLEKMEYLSVPKDLVWMDMGLPCTLMAVGTFMLVKDLKIQSRVLNYVAGLTFGIYLIHDNCWLRTWLWGGKGLFHTAKHVFWTTPKFVVYMILVCGLVFVGSGLVEAGRQFIVNMVKWVYGKIARRATRPNSIEGTSKN